MDPSDAMDPTSPTSPTSPMPGPSIPTAPSTPPGPPGPAAPPVDGTVPGWPVVPARSGPDHLWVIAIAIAAVPLVLALFLAIVAPAFMAPLTDPTVNVLGLPPVVPYAVLLVGMVFVSGLLGRYVRSGILGVVVAAIWMPVGLFLVLLGPAMVLIYQGITSGGA